MADVLSDHGLAEALGCDEHDVARGTEELEADGGLNERTVDLRRPVPIVVGDRLEGTEVTSGEASF